MKKILKRMPAVRVGKRLISGRANLNKILWDKGYTVRIWKKYFLIYELDNSL